MRESAAVLLAQREVRRSNTGDRRPGEGVYSLEPAVVARVEAGWQVVFRLLHERQAARQAVIVVSPEGQISWL